MYKNSTQNVFAFTFFNSQRYFFPKIFGVKVKVKVQNDLGSNYQ